VACKASHVQAAVALLVRAVDIDAEAEQNAHFVNEVLLGRCDEGA
jgi:hypothetical protein